MLRVDRTELIPLQGNHTVHWPKSTQANGSGLKFDILVRVSARRSSTQRPKFASFSFRQETQSMSRRRPNKLTNKLPPGHLEASMTATRRNNGYTRRAWLPSFVLLLAGNGYLVKAAEGEDEPQQVCSDENNDNNSCHVNVDVGVENPSTEADDDDPPCRLWLDESTKFPGTLGVYSGINIEAGNVVGEGEAVLPLFNTNDNKKSQWSELTWTGEIQADLMTQNYYNVHTLIPGLSSTLSCSEENENVRSKNDLIDIRIDSVNVSRSTSPQNAGSFSYRYPFEFITTHNVMQGEELFTDCDDPLPRTTTSIMNSDHRPTRQPKPIKDLKSSGVCMDGISVQKSTIGGAGRGAFTNRVVKAGDIITTSPTILLDRSQMKIVSQTFDDEDTQKMIYSEIEVIKQLMINYCYGHPNSTVLMFPYGPGMSFINHASSSSRSNDSVQQPNAILKWSNHPLSRDKDQLLSVAGHAGEVLTKSNIRLFVDVVALRDLNPYEEILIDYGDDWSQAWEEHVTHNTISSMTAAAPEYISADDYKNLHSSDHSIGYIKTLDEQDDDPYPDNIRTVCMYMEYESSLNGDDEDSDRYYYQSSSSDYNRVYWSLANHGACLRPCDVVTRHTIAGHIYYDVKVYGMINKFHESHCELAKGRSAVLGIPEEFVTVVDREYSSDVFWSKAFRHEIGIPEGMFPREWTTERIRFGESRTKLINRLMMESSSSAGKESDDNDDDKKHHYRSIASKEEEEEEEENESKEERKQPEVPKKKVVRASETIKHDMPKFSIRN